MKNFWVGFEKQAGSGFHPDEKKYIKGYYNKTLRKEKAKGIGVGGAAGGAVGYGASKLLKKKPLIGAAIGAAAGIIGGGRYGKHQAKKQVVGDLQKTLAKRQVQSHFKSKGLKAKINPNTGYEKYLLSKAK